MKMTPDGVYTWANRAGRDFFGENVIGRAAETFLVGEAEMPARQPPFGGSTGHIDYVESWQRRVDGQKRLLGWYRRTLEDRGKGRENPCLAIDLTESKKDELSLRKNDTIMRLILKNSLDGIITIDEKGLIFSFNLAVERLFGYGAEEILGRNVALLMPEPNSTRHTGYINAYLKTGVAKIIGKGREEIGLRKDGTTFPLFLSVGRDKPRQNRCYFVAVLRDLSREKTIQAQLRQAHKMESLGTLTGGIAHDFNNILGGILGPVELMLEDADKESYLAEDLHEMMRGCHRAKSLIQQIMTFTRQDRPERQSMHLHAVIKESLNLLRATLPTTIEIRRHIDSDCEPIMGNTTQIHQLMMNLCTNAGHAMGEEGGILEVSLRQIVLDEKHTIPDRQLPYGDYLELVVSDNGAGMEEEVLGRAFDPFFTTKSIGEGTGMGLAVVHGIVQNHEGAITLESVPGLGTRINIYFPVWREPVAQIDELDQNGVGA